MPNVCRVLVLFALLTGWVRANAAASEARFSYAVPVAERVQLGLTKLTSDQLAVLDALVRRDIAARASPRPDAAAAAEKFSQRLSENERSLIGLALLSPEELARLDAAVERHSSAALTRSLLAPPVFVSRSRMAEPTEVKEKREIHGSFSLSYGWGKGGYSERTGSMMMTFDDPARRYSVTIGYSESHIKGPDGGYIIQGPPLRPER